MFYSYSGGKENLLLPGDYLILYPKDGHMPCVYIDEPELVRKIVIKLKINR